VKIAISVSEKEKAKGMKSPYFQALLAVGVNPEELKLITATDGARVGTEHYDGVLFAGGGDIDPGFYGDQKRYPDIKPDRARDKFEFRLLDTCVHQRLPILGICRGIQTINVKLGGTLYQDVVNDGVTELDHRSSNPRSRAVHGIVVTEPGSQLAQILPTSCRVNSLHRQAIKRLGRGLRVTAHSEDGLVEAVESAEDYPFLMAVQWHPEEMVDQPEQRKLFEQFVAKCREAAKKRS
jgi:putative glutamine amidotransferase